MKTTIKTHSNFKINLYDCRRHLSPEELDELQWIENIAKNTGTVSGHQYARHLQLCEKVYKIKSANARELDH